MKKWLIILNSIVFIIVGLIIYNFNIVKNIEIKLKSREKITITIGDKWNDPGYEVSNSSYHDKVKINSNLDTNKEGTYKIEYILKIGLFSKKTERIVNVSSSDGDLSIKLNGDNPYYLLNNNEYIEHGVTAYDVSDGDITNKVIINSNVDSKQSGNYEVTYEVTSNDGITKTIRREVIVYSFDFTGKTKYTDYSQDNEIIIDINDAHYRYTMLPNGVQESNKNIVYKVEENGLYRFTFYDENNNKFNYEVTISNIDREKPTGKCTLSLNDNSGTIMVEAKDNTGVTGYEYLYGKNKTEIIQENKYDIGTLDDEASVIISDKAKNATTVKCDIVDNSTKLERSYTLKTHTYNGKEWKYWFYAPKDNTARKKMPLLVYFHGDGGRPNPDGVNKYEIPKYVNEGEDFPFYMIAPYCSNQIDFSHETYMAFVIDLIDYLSKNYNIDTDRVIISGGSSGARGAYAIAATYQNKFSCLVILSGITYQLYTEREKKLTYLPIWVFHGKNDQVVNYNDVKVHVDNINSYGGNVKLTTYDGGHDSTDQAFKTKEVIEWMISQRKK